jgi:hypothetical protein
MIESGIKKMENEIELNNSNNNFRNEFYNHMIDVDSTNIKFIENPSEQLQVKAIKDDPKNIRFIDNPCVRAQLIAVTRDHTTLIYIDNAHQDTINQAFFMSILAEDAIDLLDAV